MPCALIAHTRGTDMVSMERSNEGIRRRAMVIGRRRPRQQGGSRRGMTAATVICVVALVIAATAATPSGLGLGTPRCKTARLHLTLVRREGGVGHRYWILALRNIAGVTCHLWGYPGVGLLDRRGRP